MLNVQTPQYKSLSVADTSAVSSTDFREAMSQLPSSVHIVTTDGTAGRGGITASAVSSVTADPPIMLFCVNRTSSSADLFVANRCFCINALAPGDQYLSDVFAGRTPLKREERFAEGIWTKAVTGAPVLTTALVYFDCRLVDATEVSTHMILLGVVEDIRISEDRGALLYARRDYIRV